MFPHTALAVFGLAATLLAWAMAAFVLASAPARRTNRALAMVLFFEGAAHTEVLDIWTSAALDWGVASVHALGVLGAVLAYLLFLGTIDSPLAAPLRAKPVRAALMFGIPGVFVWLLSASHLFVEASTDSLDGATAGPALRWGYILFGVINLFGLAVAVTAYRRAGTGTEARRRAKAYAWAFGVRDVFYAFALLVPWSAVAALGLGQPQPFLIEAAAILFVLIMAYGVLKARLFDLDLRIKWTIRQSTVAAAFVAVFFIASEGAASFFAGRTGSTAVGIAAAGALVFALAPLQRLAERVSHRAMPGVEPTDAYVTYRKMEVYRAAVEGVWEDRGVTAKERAMLDRLRRELGINTRDAEALERDVERRALAQ